MNSITVACIISEQPVTRLNEKQELIAEAFAVLDQEESNGAVFKLKGFRTTAEVLSQLSVGTKVFVSGNIQAFRVERPEGFKENVIAISVRQCVPFAAGVSQPAAKPVQQVVTQSPQPEQRVGQPVAQPQTITHQTIPQPVAANAYAQTIGGDDIDNIPF